MNLQDYEFTRRSRGGLFVGRVRTCDDAFKFRMGAGFPGDVNRTHPASIEPAYPDATLPPTLFGQPVMLDGTTKNPRSLSTGDSAVTSLYGVVVRPYPTQQPTAATANAPATFNSGGPAANAVLDILRFGYIMVKLGNGAITGATKGGPVFVWVAASTGNHVQGQFETAAGGGSNTAALDVTRYMFNGVEDANGVVELYVR